MSDPTGRNTWQVFLSFLRLGLTSFDDPVAACATIGWALSA